MDRWRVRRKDVGWRAGCPGLWGSRCHCRTFPTHAEAIAYVEVQMRAERGRLRGGQTEF